MMLIRNPGKVNMLRLKPREIKHVAEETLGNQKSSVKNPRKLNKLRGKSWETKHVALEIKGN
jgi:hypothetical protein